jgi:hypothetical protein
VDTIHEALELLTGMPAGRRNAQGRYPAGTLLALARERAYQYWVKSLQTPADDVHPRPSRRRKGASSAGTGGIDLS